MNPRIAELIEIVVTSSLAWYLTDPDRLNLVRPKMYLALSRTCKSVASSAGMLGIRAEHAYHSSLDTVRS